MENIERVKVPKDRYELFKHQLLIHVALFRADDDPYISNCVELLVNAIDRHIHDKRSGVGYKRDKIKKLSNTQQFIKQFQVKFYQYHDIEYKLKISSKDTAIISGLIKKLEEEGSNHQEYIEWWFDDWLPDNRKFEGNNLTTMASDFFIQQFLVQNITKIKARKKKQNMMLLTSTLSQQARALIRGGHKELVPDLQKFTDGEMNLEQFNKAIKNAGGQGL
jgi:hypothetical protein